MKLIAIPTLLAGLAAGAAIAEEYENLARRPDTVLTGSVAKAGQLELLRDGALEPALLTGKLAGTEFTFTLAEPREIDHLVIHTPGGPDWSIASKIAVTVDGEPAADLALPNFFRHAERFDLKRRVKSITFRVQDVHAQSPADFKSPLTVRPWGGFAEIELNATTASAAECAFAAGSNGWYPADKVQMTFAPGTLTFRGVPDQGRLARLTPYLDVGAGTEQRIAVRLKGAPANLQLALFEETPQKRYVTTLTVPELAFPGGDDFILLTGKFKIPGDSAKRYRGELQLNAPGSGEVTVTLGGFSVTPEEGSGAAIRLPERWKFQYDRWTALGDYSWTNPDAPDADWAEVPVPGRLTEAGHRFYYGALRYRATVGLTGPAGLRPSYKLRLGKIAADDKAFFNGVEVGALLGIGVGSELRPEYLIPAGLVRDGRNVIAVEAVPAFKDCPGIYAGPVTLTAFGDREYAIRIETPGHDGHLFLKGEPVRFRFEVLAGARPSVAAPKLAWQIRDYYGRPVASGERFVELSSGGGVAELELPLPQTGWYAIETRLTDGARLLAEKKSSLGVLYDLSGPRGPLENSPFGINLGAAVQRKTSWFDDFPLLAKAGIDHVRIDINWDIIEHEQGKYDWTVADNYVAAARKHHLRIFPIMISVPHWNTRKSAAAEQSEWNKIYYAPDDTAPWKAFMTAAAARYRNDIREWEIWNEPNHGIGGSFWRGDAAKLCEMVRLAGAAIKSVDPQATVIAPGMALTDPNYVRKMGREGALAHLDAISYHPYRHNTTPEADDNTLAFWDLSAGAGTPGFERDELRRAMREFNMDKPLYSTEFGWALHGSNLVTVTPEQQAEYLVRYHALMIPSIKRLFWYEFRNRVLGYEDMAIIHADKTPLPAYVAFNVMARFLRDATPAGEKNANGIYRIDYVKNHAPVAVLWSVTPARSLVIRADSELALYDIMGVETRRVPAGQVATVELGESPFYVTGSFALLPVAAVTPATAALTPGASVETEVTLHNPLERELAGKLQISAPGDLQVELLQPEPFFRIAPGQTRTLRGRITARPTAGLGARLVTFSFEFNERWRIGNATANITVKIGFPPEQRVGYLRNWLLAGPFAAPRLLADGPGGEAQFDPVAGDALAGKQWIVCDPAMRRQSNAYPPPEAVDFGAVGISGKQAVGYAFLRIRSPEAREAILRLGSDDGAAAWVNGREVFRKEAVRGVSADEDAAPIRLEKGWNTLLLKISNGALDWCFIARLTTPDGAPMSDLEYSVAKPAAR